MQQATKYVTSFLIPPTNNVVSNHYTSKSLLDGQNTWNDEPLQNQYNPITNYRHTNSASNLKDTVRIKRRFLSLSTQHLISNHSQSNIIKLMILNLLHQRRPSLNKFQNTPKFLLISQILNL